MENIDSTKLFEETIRVAIEASITDYALLLKDTHFYWSTNEGRKQAVNQLVREHTDRALNYLMRKIRPE